MNESEDIPQEPPTVYIGKKNMSYYINVCLKLFEKKNNKQVIVEGMGSNIKKAVDVANFLRFIYKTTRINIEDISIDLVEGEVVRGLPKKVSRIRITLSRE